MAVEEQAIFEYLDEFLRVDVSMLDSRSPLFSSGVIDSFSMIDLITHLEGAYGIGIEPADITLDNFDTVGRIVAFISGKL